MVRAKGKGIRQNWQRQMVAYAPYLVLAVLLIIAPSFIGAYFRSMLTKVLIFGIFAMSLNLIYGYTGLWSLGHAAFFGMAGYTNAILIVRLGIDSFWLAAPAGILVGVLTAVIFGVISLRVSGIYFLFVTMALGQLLYGIAYYLVDLTGGTNGLHSIPYPNLGLPFRMTTTNFYYFVFLVFVISCFLLYRIIKSPFGQALQGIRDDERRMQHLGYNTWLYKYVAIIIASFFAGVAGVFYGHYNGILVPDHLGIFLSAVAMLMVIIGSDRVVFGPVLGAAVIVLLEHFSSIYSPERWPLILGGVFVIAIMFLRGGISVHLVRLWNKVRYRYGST